MRPVKAAAAGALIVLLGLTAAGCETIERETGLGTGAQAGAAGGAATGGLIAALAGANPAWIAFSVIAGGVAGGFLGDALDDNDKQYHANSGYQAFETQDQGGSTSWNNPDSGNSGSTTIDNTFTRSDGTQCKNFTQTINAEGKEQTVYGTACQQADGTWKIVRS